MGGSVGRVLREGGTSGFIGGCLVDERGEVWQKGEAQGRARGLEREMGHPREAQENLETE